MGYVRWEIQKGLLPTGLHAKENLSVTFLRAHLPLLSVEESWMQSSFGFLI